VGFSLGWWKPAIERRLNESVFRTLIRYFKSQARNPKDQTAIQVSDHQLWNQFATFEHAMISISIGSVAGGDAAFKC
jgi:hypothetical protein